MVNDNIWWNSGICGDVELKSCENINNKFNNYYTFYKIIIFIFGFLTLFISEILIKYTGNDITQDTIIFIFPFILFLSIYLFVLKKNYSQ